MRASITWFKYQQLISAINSDSRIKELLTSSKAKKQFLFHRRLVDLLAEPFKKVKSGIIESVALLHYLHFQYFYFSINQKYLLDHKNYDSANDFLLLLEKKSRKIAFGLIGNNNQERNFLNDQYDYLKQHVDIYNAFIDERKNMSYEDYHTYEAPLAMVLQLPVKIFSLLCDDPDTDEVLTKGMAKYYLGKKITTDIASFKVDADTLSWNFVQSRFENAMLTEGINIESMDSAKKTRYFFVSGTAELLYSDAISFFEQNIELWNDVPSAQLRQFPNREIIQVRKIVDSLDQLIDKARNGVKK